MDAKTRICQNCKTPFTIEPEDFLFYEKIHVPPPTFCPECRLVRRLLFRNERVLYTRACDLCGKHMVARYAASAAFPVYCVPCWYSDKWEALAYGQDYDFSKPFFAQLVELGQKVPRPAMYAINAINSDYCNQCLNVKDVYLSSSIISCENIYYSYRIDKSKDVFNTSCGVSIEHCADDIDVAHCYEVHASRYAENSYKSAFLYDAHGSHDCFGCVNIRNAQFRIFNHALSRAEYEKEIMAYDLGSYSTYCAVREKFESFKQAFPRRYTLLEKTVNTIGDNVYNAKNCYGCFDSYNIENSKYAFAAIDGVKDSYDVSYSGLGCELCYEGWSFIGLHNKFSIAAQGQDSEYCEWCQNRTSTHLFGCISMTKEKHYCILNKQYTKEEYEALLPKIIEHMNAMPYVDAKGRVYKYGEFFPPELSPFAYNETIAQEYFPLTKAQAIEQGYRWKEPEERNIQITLSPQDLPDHIKDVPDSIINQIIGCMHATSPSSTSGQSAAGCNEQCTTAFKIIPQELAFYRKMNLPLPRLCPNCRHYQRLKQRNPLKLWHRRCMCNGKASYQPAALNSPQQIAESRQPIAVYANTASHRHGSTPCTEEFETSYAPERPEIVYCEHCYNAEVV